MPCDLWFFKDFEFVGPLAIFCGSRPERQMRFLDQQTQSKKILLIAEKWNVTGFFTSAGQAYKARHFNIRHCCV